VRSSSPAPSAYAISVFINCPFDPRYRALFRAAVFTVYQCGYVPRCALEAYDSGQVRIDKICALIERCRFGLHDISRTELDRRTRLPRFNMPLELGIFLGAQRFGATRQRRKNCLVVDRDQFRYQRFISDISGQDISAHHDDVETLIQVIRDWLGTADGRRLPGGRLIMRHFARFRGDLPRVCRRARLAINQLTFADYANLVSEWLSENKLRA
jgi:hypothetical protein